MKCLLCPIEVYEFREPNLCDTHLKEDIRRRRNVHGKRCPSCYAHKPVIEYDRNARQWDGLQSYCRACNGLRRTLDLSTWHTVRDALRKANADKV